MDCIDYQQFEAAMLELENIGISKLLVTTWEMETMSPAQVLTYLLQEVRQAVLNLLASMIFYGQGKDHTRIEQGGTVIRPRPQLYGVFYQTSDANQKGVSATIKKYGTDYADMLEVIQKAPTDLYAKNPDAIEGAEIHMSFMAYSALRSMRDTTGRPLFDPIRPLSLVGSDVQFPLVLNTALKGMDVVVGNPANYFLNEIDGVKMYNDQNVRCRANQYVAWGMYSGMGYPNSFIAITDSDTPRGALPADVVDFRKKINYRGGKTA
jgi:HK97 family phage major capsid protein